MTALAMDEPPWRSCRAAAPARSGRCSPGSAAACPDYLGGGCNALTGPSVSDDDMPDFPWLRRSDVPPHLGRSPGCPAHRASDRMRLFLVPGPQPVAEVLAAMRAAVEDSEPAGWNQALAEFRGTSGVSHTSRRSSRRSRGHEFALRA